MSNEQGQVKADGFTVTVYGLCDAAHRMGYNEARANDEAYIDAQIDFEYYRKVLQADRDALTARLDAAMDVLALGDEADAPQQPLGMLDVPTLDVCEVAIIDNMTNHGTSTDAEFEAWQAQCKLALDKVQALLYGKAQAWRDAPPNHHKQQPAMPQVYETIEGEHDLLHNAPGYLSRLHCRRLAEEGYGLFRRTDTAKDKE